MKKTVSILILFAMIFSLCVSAFAEPVTVTAVKPVANTPIDEQIRLIYANLTALSKDDETTKEKWYYALTDLDHNGCLEFITANIKGSEFYTYAYIYEVGADLSSFTQCDMGVKEGDPFVDIISASADTFYDKDSDTWYYMFTEGYADNTDKYYAVKCSVSLKEGYVTPAAYAKETTESINGVTVATYLDMEDKIITPDEFNDAGNNKFAKCEKNSTNFDWFRMDEVKSVARLTESYEVFAGLRQAEKKVEIVPAPTPTPASKFLMITKNPTSEYSLQEGDRCWFVSYADNASSLVWTFVSPSGGEYSAQSFEYQFPQCNVSGENTVNLCIENVCEAMSGWGAYCTFYGNGQSARSSTAYMSVKYVPEPTPVPTREPDVWNNSTGYVSDFLMSSVTIYLPEFGTSVQVLKDVCTVWGSLDYGCEAVVCYKGYYPTESSIYSVSIYGYDDPYQNPEIDPVIWDDPYEIYEWDDPDWAEEYDWDDPNWVE